MKKIFNFTKKKKVPSNTPDNGSVLSVGYELKEKDLGKVHKAASVGDVAKLKQLAKKNDINQLDKENRTALHIACASGHVELVQFLVESKAKLNLCDNQNRSALMKAVQGQHEHCVSILLENHAEPNLVDINGNSALHLAANIPAISTAMLLLEHGADVNAQNKEGFTPLTVAVRENHAEMAEFLLKEGADVNFKDQGQRSPLMIAAGNGQINMLRLLLQFDADITLKDTKGWSSDEHAVMNGHHACSHLIIEHGTKRNAMPSLSHQVPSKKKKKTLLGSPSQEVEAGFPLGGPATDKDEHGANEAGRDTEDNSQSESLSRPSKSAADDWPSSEDDDESDLIPKKPHKVNLRKLIASKKGEDADSGAELGKSEPSEQPSSCKARSDSPEGSPEAEDSEEEDDNDEDDEDEDDDDEEDDDNDEDEGSEDEDEGEDEEDEGEDEEDEEEQECEEEEEDDDNAVASVLTNTIGIEDIQKLSGTDLGSGNAQNVPGTDISYNKVIDPSLVGIGENVEAPENATNTETQNNENVSSAGTSNYGMPVTLDVEDDCVVVSAIRVESKLSDEDDSLGKESIWSSDQNIISDLGSTAGLMTSRYSTETHSPSKVEEDFDKEKEKDDDDDPDTDSWSDKPDNGDTVWNDSDDDGNQKGGFGRNTVLANRSNMVPEDEGEDNSDGSFDAKDDDDNGSYEKTSKVGKRRSSWGSSLEENDSDNCASPREEDMVNTDTPDQKGDTQASDFLPGATTLHSKSTSPKPNEDNLESLWDSSSPVHHLASPHSKSISAKPKVDEPKSSLEFSSPSTPHSKNRSAKAKVDQSKSEWDFSSENDDQKDGASSTKGKVLEVIGSVEVSSPFTSTNIVPSTNQAGEQQCSDDSWEDEDEENGKEESNDDTSPAVSPELKDEKATSIQILDNDGVESVAQSPEMEGKLDHQEDDDGSWDDDDDKDESDEPEKPISPIQNKATNKYTPTAVSPVQKTKNVDYGEVLKSRPSTPIHLPSPVSRPNSAMDKKLDEETEVDLSEPQKADEEGDENELSMIDGDDESAEYNSLEGKKLVDDKKEIPIKDEEKSMDSDSQDQKLQYDFASAMIKVPDVGDDSDNTLDGCLCEGDESDNEREPRLTAYVPLCDKGGIVPQTTVSLDDLDEEPVKKVTLSSPPTTDDVPAGQHHDSNSDGFSDEELPQTDIDDVDVDSHVELESTGKEGPELRNIEELVNQKEEDSTEEDDDDKEEESDEDEEDEEEGGLTDENDQSEVDEGDSPVAITPVPEREVSKDGQRDFLSELGLEKGEEEQDSCNSESHSENPNKPHDGGRRSHAQVQEKMSIVEEENKDVVKNDNDGNGGCNDSDGKDVDNDDASQKETEKAKWEPLSVLSKLEGDTDRKTDLMEELGLGNVDDLEDASDCDSASTTSRRTLPVRRMASPGIEELPECSSPSVQEQEQEITAAAPPTPKRSISSDKRMSTLPSPHALTSRSPPYPQPRARKIVPQKPESEEESDWDSDLTSSSSPVKTDNQLPNIAEHQAVVLPDSSVHEPSPMARDSESNVEPEQQQQKEKDDALNTSELELNNPRHSGLVGSESGEKDDELTDEVGDDMLWEKRYEKLWVEVEKRDVKSTFKNVAGELKEKFGEIPQANRCTAEDITEEEQAKAESSSAEEASSDEEEGELIVRPTARARSTVLLTIPEQRESGLEDSVTESAENSQCEDRIQACEPPCSEGSKARDIDLLSDGFLEDRRSPSPQLSAGSYTAWRDCNINHATKVFTDGHVEPMSDDVNLNSSLNDEAKPEPIQQPQPELTLECNIADLDEAEKNCASSDEDPEEFTQSQPPLLSIRSAATPGVSDEDLEEDMQRFKHEVGMLKVVFLDLEKEKVQLQKEVGKERTKTAMEFQKSSAPWDAGGTEVEGVEAEKPETSIGSRKKLSSGNGSSQREQQLAASHSITQRLGSESPKSTNRAPVQLCLPLQQNYNNSKQEGQAVAVEGTSQLELVRVARRNRAPKTNTHVNGDPLSVFDDSTLSEVSDDDGRLPSGAQRRDEIQNPGEMEMADDFDELTQSSDTASDDIASPTSGYRHASLIIQELDSATLDSRTMVKLQNIFHEYGRSIQKERSRHGHLADKVSQLEMERAELKSSLEEIKDVKSALERNQLEFQTEVTNLKFQLKQEQENRRNATMMYNTTRDKLKRTEEQQQLEVEERQRVELTLRNLELEMRTLVSNMKQLEDDHSETQRLLAQERSARTLQENLLNSHLRKQQEIEEENRRNISKSNEALSQLTEASDREKELLQQTATLQEELSILRTELERSRANSSLKESHLTEESEALKEQLEDARRDLKLNSEALAQTVFQYNSQLTTLKSELTVTTTHLENERQTREMLEAEVDSTRNRLAGALQEAERCQAAHADAEKSLLREKEDHQRLKDKYTGEAASQREAVSSLSQKLAKTETRSNSMENEVHRTTLQLTEKGVLLEVLQREKDQAAARVKELETALQAERELVSRARARLDATQERLAQSQSEGMLMRQQLEEVQNKGVAKDHAVTDAQERFSDILSKLRSDCEERVQLVEERSKELASKAADLRDQVYKLEEEKNERETGLRQLQQELADSLKKLSMSEATLEVNTRYRNDLEEEKARLLKDMERLKGKLEESEDQYVQAERRINSLKSTLDERERELTTAAQKLQEVLSASAGSDTTIRQLEEAVQRLEIENARLEAAAKQQSNKIDALQKGAQEAAMVRSRLEDLVANLQGSKMTLEDELSREVQKQSMLSHTAQDSQALWEEELKSRSKLGLRLAELEKEKGELNTQMEMERKKAKKIAEQKKAVDTRLDQEMKRNTELQKEMYRLRTLLKTAKKKLREQDGGGAEFGSPMSSLRMEMGRNSQSEGAIGRMKEKVDDLQVQLEKEASRCSQLEKVNGELKEQLTSLKSLSRSNERLERSKRQLEEEVSGLRRQMEAGLMDQSQAEQYRRDAEERARQEIQQKLGEVNLFLQSQAASQEALDQIKSANEANLRSQLEQRIQELEGELGRARTTQQDSLNQRDSTRTELEQYRKLYTEELRLRKSLAAKLERANNRRAEANAKLLNEHHRSKSLIASSIINGSLGGPSLDVGSFGSATTYGATLGPLNRSLGLGLPLLSPMIEGQSSTAEDYLAKMRSELDRNISKELNRATAELEGGSVRMSPVGSASGVELDPVSRATQQYLEVLKKNYMI